MLLDEQQAARLLLVRAVEEIDPTVFTDEALAAAHSAAGTKDIGMPWLLRRGDVLFEKLSTGYQTIAQLGRAPAPWLLPLTVATFVFGVGTNLLGSMEKLHVVRNPVFVLIGWNFCVYIGLLALSLYRLRPQQQGSPTLEDKTKASSEPPGKTQPLPENFTGRDSWLHVVLPGVWRFFHRMLFGVHMTRTTAAIVRRFADLWFGTAARLVHARWRLMLHLGALSMAMGAIAGMYGRGLFQGYRVSWASTFITQPEAVQRFIEWAFGPALILSRWLGMDVASQISVARLLALDGDDAEPWFHLFALSVVLTIVIPRSLLSLWQWQWVRRQSQAVEVQVDAYYGTLIEAPMRTVFTREVEASARQFVASVSQFVQTHLYDEQIVPRLRAFRRQGGKVAQLRTDLNYLAESFLPEIDRHIASIALPAWRDRLRDSTASLAKGIDGGALNWGAAPTNTEPLGLATGREAQNSITQPLGVALGASVAAPIALTFATVGGGLGQELGIAIISTLLGTTGPVGFVIGLLGGLVVAGAAWWLGKDTVVETVVNLELPATVVRTVLSEARFERLVEDGRVRCQESLREVLDGRVHAIQSEVVEHLIDQSRQAWRPDADSSI